MSGRVRAALYLRLSKDDGGENESSSIASQRALLREFALLKGFEIADEYIDSGVSGTTFDRPGFGRMLADIELGRVSCVIVKDLSRLGRDYIAAGQFTELYFPERNVRCIAVNDGYDSALPADDALPFRHVVNEMYARDTSKKIRSALAAKMRAGRFIGAFAPYGYAKAPADKNRLVIDLAAAAVVRDIFESAMRGSKPSEIARSLNARGIASPRAKQKGEYLCNWSASTVCKILSNTVYLGHLAQGKSRKPSFKSRAAVRRPADEWIVAENTHEPIIPRELFDLVRSRCLSRKGAADTGFKNAFAGVAKCADCGGNMTPTASRKKGAGYNLVCARYKLRGQSACSNHSIDYDLLYNRVLQEFRTHLALSSAEKAMFLHNICDFSRLEDLPEAAQKRREMNARERELDALIQRLFEQNARGQITDARFLKLSATYELEQRELCARLSLLRAQSEDTRQRADDRTIEQIACFEELTPQMLKIAVERIEISQGEWENTSGARKKRQKIKIFWRFCG